MTTDNNPSERSNERSEDEGLKITDKRRLDPVTGELREPIPAPAAESKPAAQPTPPAESAEALGDALDVEIADLLSGDERVTELTADLQRMAAEYANYRKRVERERVATAEIAAASVLAALLPVLDDVARAREHGELEGAFKTVGDSLGAVVARLGLETYAEVGDVFDPELHEALTHTEGAGREQAICAEIYQPGYKYKGRVVRPARVSVSE